MAYKKIEEVTDEVWESQINETNRILVDEFLQQEHLSSQTLKQYKSALRIFAKWVNDFCIPKGKVLIPNLKPRDALKYQNWLISKGLSSSAIKFKRSAVSSLCGYIEIFYSEEYPNFRNIYTKAIPNVAKTAKKEKEILTPEEIEKLSDVLYERGEWQKLAYLWFTYITGCRREESRQLLKEIITYEKSVDKKTKEVKPYYLTHSIRAKGKGKEGKQRKFKVDERAMQAIKKWIEYRETLVESDDCPYVFVSKRKDGYKQLSANTLNLWCQEFSEILGGRPVHPHLFRSSRATNAKDAGADIKSIQKLLGHNSSETTEIYIVRDDEDDDDELY
ncbi:tyrosine-type recombinase/integrase [Bacillus velezensis]|uniref:tyrosine-type recombinase/integrase n=1 Tax=Bacillus velezensis TaxID=492670 RepID=UPI0018C4D3E5|nr:tyrosine-type recombinase/integrase [Bacillus velezensis]QPK89723.1 tyrosine-type recombinase/integrase [Bacillus velezensis]